ncbi:MAG: response regulator [Acidobacteriota bacterium]
MTKVLIVDDEPVIVNLLQKFLTQKGYQTITASSGEEALKRVREDSPALVLLDVYMPGKTGIEVLREIKELQPDLGVIMVTAASDEGIGRKALELGAFDYVSKPFDLGYLEKVVWWKVKTMEDSLD